MTLLLDTRQPDFFKNGHAVRASLSGTTPSYEATTTWFTAWSVSLQTAACRSSLSCAR